MTAVKRPLAVVTDDDFSPPLDRTPQPATQPTLVLPLRAKKLLFAATLNDGLNPQVDCASTWGAVQGQRVRITVQRY
jgi:hypothetical protein